jgi:hypothetical protein
LTNNESHKHEDQLDEVPRSEKVVDKCIVRQWEELRFKRNRYGLGYVKDVNNLFHIPNYCEPVCFVSGGFLNVDKKTMNDDKKTNLEEQAQDIVVDDVVTDIPDHDNNSDKESIQCKHYHASLSMISQTILIFTHAAFVGRKITPR